MGYKEGTIAATADSSAAMYAVLATELTAAGYTLVDTVTIGSRTHKVWKSPAASNALGQDWFLDVAYTLTGVSPVYLMPFEQWDAAEKKAIRAPFWGPIALPVDAATGSRFGNTGYALEDGSWGGYYQAGGQWCPLIVTASATFAYYLHVTADRIIMHSQASGETCYVGLLKPSAELLAVPSYIPFPLYTVKWNSNAVSPTPADGGQGCGLSRMTPAPASIIFNNIVPSVPAACVIPKRAVDPLPPRLYPIAVASNVAVGNSSYQNLIFGTLDGLYSARVEATVQRGDRVTVGVDEYVILRGTGNAGWLVKAS